MCEITKEDRSGMDDKSPLLPDRHPTTDLFVCDVLDAVPKGDMASMEHPIFSLSTKPDTRLRRYGSEDNDGPFIEVAPSVRGLATVHDRDILIYCISQIMAAINAGRRVEKTVRLKAHDLLIATNRVTDGRGYEGLKLALQRLGGTRITTNIQTGGKEVFDDFGIIDHSRIVRETRDGRMHEVEITLSDWVFDAIRANEVLTLNRDYFRLRKPLERRMYELARKHCGNQKEWRISLERLKEKCGSNSSSKEFKRLVSHIVEQNAVHDHFPDYEPELINNTVLFTHRKVSVSPAQMSLGLDVDRLLSDDDIQSAKKHAPGYDIYGLHEEWKAMVRMRGEMPKHPRKAFHGFCRYRAKEQPER